jgi:hypothetical protein
VIERTLEHWSPGRDPGELLMLNDPTLALFAMLLDHQLDSVA